MRRVITGAHYGLRDWLAQRVTAVVMAAYSIVVFGFIATTTNLNYAAWRDFFNFGWVRVATLLFVVSLAWHAWVGVRDILMDYIKPDGLRLTLQIGTVLVIAAYIAWTVQILWR